MNTKLLIVDDTEASNEFLNNYVKNIKLYRDWDIYFKSSKQKLVKEIKFWGNENIATILEKNKLLYKQFLVIKSSDYFIKNYNLDLISSVLSFPLINQDNNINQPYNTNTNYIILDDYNIYYKLIKFDILKDEAWKLKKQTHQFVNYLFIRTVEEPIKIDYVFPYVTSDDPNWVKDYLKYKNLEASKIESENKKDARYEANYSTGLQRFRDNGILKYTFRSIAKNLPWINKVHMIVSSKSQVPSWVNQNEVDIITHDEFMPKNLLPSFSSSEIEMFLPFLPRVSEYFLYGNDDTYIMRPQKIQNWFFNKKVVTYSTIRPIVNSFSGDIFRHNDLRLIAPDTIDTEKLCLGQQHCVQPYILSKMKECYQKYEKQILASCTRFRENTKNFNQHIYLGYNQFNNYLYQKKRLCLTTDLTKWDKSINLQKYTCISVNDSSENISQENLQDFLNKINTIFLSKSKYEL